MDAELLDDPQALEAADPRSVLRSLAGAGAQVRNALELTAESLPARWSGDRPRAVLVAARGGAAVVADALAAVVGTTGPVPVIALSGGRLPAWVGSLDLVIALSLSGKAEGAVAIGAEAGRRGASLLTVGGAGSPLQQVCERFRGAHVPLPQPDRSATSAATSRTALWSLLTPAMVACDRLGLLPEGGMGSAPDMAAVADALDEEAEVCRVGSESFVNPAKALVLQLDGTVPVILGDSQLAAVAARRAASVLSRTARIPAVHGALPDDAGDIVATFGGPFATSSLDDVFADPFLDGPCGTALRLLLLDLQDGIGFDAVRALAERSGVKVTQVQANLVEDPDDVSVRG